MFIGRTDVEAETPVLWPPDVKSWLIWKNPDAGKGLRQEEKGTTEDEMVEWHHRLDGHGFGWTLAVGDGQGGLVCCGSWGHKVGHNWATELNWSEPQSTPSLVFADCIELLHLQLKEYNQCDFCIDYLFMSMLRVISCVVGGWCLLWPVRSLGKTLLAFVLLHFVLQAQTCLLFQVSLDFLLRVPDEL